MADLLGIPSGLDIFTKAQEDRLMDNELDYFWGSIQGTHTLSPIPWTPTISITHQSNIFT